MASTTIARQGLTEQELDAIDEQHPMWGRYARPPLAAHPAVASYLDDERIEHEGFANWVNNMSGPPLFCYSENTAELLALAKLYACHRHEGAPALNAARRARAAMH